MEKTKDADGNDVTTVIHTAFEALDALTIAMDPAYEETSVSARELREDAGGLHCTAAAYRTQPREGAAAQQRPTEPGTSSDDERRMKAATNRRRREMMMERDLGGTGLEDILNL